MRLTTNLGPLHFGELIDFDRCEHVIDNTLRDGIFLGKCIDAEGIRGDRRFIARNAWSLASRLLGGDGRRGVLGVSLRIVCAGAPLSGRHPGRHMCCGYGFGASVRCWFGGWFGGWFGRCVDWSPGSQTGGVQIYGFWDVGDVAQTRLQS